MRTDAKEKNFDDVQKVLLTLWDPKLQFQICGGKKIPFFDSRKAAIFFDAIGFNYFLNVRASVTFRKQA